MPPSETRELADWLARGMAAADVLGRIHVARRLAGKRGRAAKLSDHIPFAADETILLKFRRVPPGRALEFLRGLTPTTRELFDRLLAKYGNVAFTAAALDDERLIGRVRDALADVVKEGGTQADFDRAVSRLTTRAGLEELSSFYTETVFRTNVQTAYAVGRFEQQTSPDVVAAMPFWRYVTAGDDRVRPEHAAMDGFAARWDDPVWRRWYPPNGYNCRCIVVSELESDVDAAAGRPAEPRIPRAAAAGPEPGFGHSPSELAGRR